MPNKTAAPPDQSERDKILNGLDRTMLVEAAAGTGKTTSMVSRMVALLAEGKCEIDRIAAITFTKKSAAELRERFQAELADRARGTGGERGGRLRRASDHVEQAFIGTIHSFCARLLRERPIEAGVDLSFREMDDDEDTILRKRAWDEYVAKLYAEGSPLLERLDRLGIRIGRLEATFLRFTDFPDVEEWPAPVIPLPDFSPVIRKLEAYVREMQSLAPEFPEEYGSDKLIPRYQLIPRLVRWKDLQDPAQLMDVLLLFGNQKVTQKEWRLGNGEKPDKERAKAEQERWNAFRENVATPALESWREYCYPTVLEAIRPACEHYDQLRLGAGRLNYQDLLLKAAELLRSGPEIRRYFRRRFTHLLVDEFQDTDPVQAEVMLLLTADDPKAQNWTECRPVHGSLFVVGDPKQSIYRFRRADIVTYNEVRRIIEASGGSVVQLSTNFRTLTPLVDWVNDTFQEVFDSNDRKFSPEYVALQPGRSGEDSCDLTGFRKLVLEKGKKTEPMLIEEADFIARSIRQALDKGMTVPRTEKELAKSVPSAAIASDFLIITRRKKSLGLYAQKLQEYGIPHEVTGGKGGNETKALALLYACLSAVVRPDDPVALVGTLRGELFGISDKALFEFKHAGGIFDFHSKVPANWTSDESDAIEDAFARLRRYESWLEKLALLAAVERITTDLGLVALAASGEGGNLQAGSLLKGIEILRSRRAVNIDLSDLLANLARLVEEEEAFDGIPARALNEPAVRIMNLHKVKGLEAPVVFLADPAGVTTHTLDTHIDRSGGKARGYLAVYGEGFGVGKGPLLAHPPGWGTWEAEEAAFIQAEEDRLQYVAATRAGTQIVVSQLDGAQKQNPWAFFAEALQEKETISNPGSVAKATGNVVTIAPEEIEQSIDTIRDRWTLILQPTYNVGAAKEISVSKERMATESDGHGAEWGTVIHLLLETCAIDADADLPDLARSSLAEVDLDPGLAEVAVKTVRQVLASEIWRRAMASSKRLVEVPFQKMAKPQEDSAGSLPTILRGVIDLVFWESDGWVIVDYKTDKAREGRIRELVEHYRPQLRTYSEAWAEMTGDLVKETGLYFTHSDCYVTLGVG